MHIDLLGEGLVHMYPVVSGKWPASGIWKAASCLSSKQLASYSRWYLVNT